MVHLLERYRALTKNPPRRRWIPPIPHTPAACPTARQKDIYRRECRPARTGVTNDLCCVF